MLPLPKRQSKFRPFSFIYRFTECRYGIDLLELGSASYACDNCNIHRRGRRQVLPLLRPQLRHADLPRTAHLPPKTPSLPASPGGGWALKKRKILEALPTSQSPCFFHSLPLSPHRRRDHRPPHQRTRLASVLGPHEFGSARS